MMGMEFYQDNKCVLSLSYDLSVHINWVWRKDKVREEASTGAALHLRLHGYERGSSESIIAESRDLWDPACISRHTVKPIRISHYFWVANQNFMLSLSPSDLLLY